MFTYFSLLKYTLISSLNYSDSFFYFVTWDEKTFIFIDFYFKYVCIHNTVRAVIRILMQLSPTHVNVATWSKNNGCIPMPRERIVSGT